LTKDARLKTLYLSFLVSLSVLGVGCFQPSFQSGHLKCAAGGNSCPPGFHCAGDQTCWKNGEDPTADMATAGPSSSQASAVWTSCGGGSGVGNNTGAELNLSIGGSLVVGASKATSGDGVAFGYFGNDF
jgi:hypothetical protein